MEVTLATLLATCKWIYEHHRSGWRQKGKASVSGCNECNWAAGVKTSHDQLGAKRKPGGAKLTQLQEHHFPNAQCSGQWL